MRDRWATWMKRTFLLLALAGLSLSVGAAPQAADVTGDVKVIANSSVAASDISTEDLKAVFLVVKTTLAGSQVEPVLGKSGRAHDAFLKAYLGKSDATLTAYFRGLVFTGKASMPKVCDSRSEEHTSELQSL